MPSVQNSPLHRSENLLCGNLRRTQSVNRSSFGYSPSPQHLEPSSIGERSSSPMPSTFMAPIMAPDGNVHVLHPMNPMAAECYVAPHPIYTSHPPQFSGYYATDDSRLVADTYGPFVPTCQPLDNPTNFGGIFPEPPAAHQPPMPPVPPEDSIPPNSAFQYYPCRWLGGPRCGGLAPGRNREMGEHLRVYHLFIGHERDTVQCEWENCGQTMQRMNVPRHIVSRHLLAAASCRFCGKRFSRPDVVTRHERTCAGGFLAPSSASARV